MGEENTVGDEPGNRHYPPSGGGLKNVAEPAECVDSGRRHAELVKTFEKRATGAPGQQLPLPFEERAPNLVLRLAIFLPFLIDNKVASGVLPGLGHRRLSKLCAPPTRDCAIL